MTFVSFMGFASLFEEQIKIQERSIQSYKRWMIAQFLSGVIVAGLAFLVDHPFKSPPLDCLKLGIGVFVSAFGFYPYKEIGPKRERITGFKNLKAGCENVDQLPEDERKLLVQVVIDAVKEITKR